MDDVVARAMAQHDRHASVSGKCQGCTESVAAQLLTALAEARALLAYEDGEFVGEAFMCGRSSGPCGEPTRKGEPCFDCRRRAFIAKYSG